MPARPLAARTDHADDDVGLGSPGDEGLGAVQDIVVAVALRAGGERRRVRPGAGLRQRIARQLPHGAEVRQQALAQRVVPEAVDHPGGHVVDRDIGRGGGAAGRKLLEHHGGVRAREARAADILAHIEAAEAERGRLAQFGLGENALRIPARGIGREHILREAAGGVLKCLLVFGKRKIHGQPIIAAIQGPWHGESRQGPRGCPAPGTPALRRARQRRPPARNPAPAPQPRQEDSRRGKVPQNGAVGVEAVRAAVEREPGVVVPHFRHERVQISALGI